MRTFFSILFFSFFGLQSNSQKIGFKSEEMEWRIHHVSSNTAAYHYNNVSFEDAQFFTSPTEVIVPVEFRKGGYGLVKLTNTGKVLWETGISGKVIGLGKIGDKVFVLFTNAQFKSVFSSVLNTSNGKLTTGKELFVSEKDPMEFYTKKTATGEIQHLLLRSTIKSAWGGYNLPYFPLARTLETLSLHLLKFDEKGDVINTLQLEIPEKSLFIGSAGNSKGSVFLAYLLDAHLVMDQYDNAGKLVNSLKTPFNIHKSSKQLAPVIINDKTSDEILWLSASYLNSDKDEAYRLLRFDFSTKKITSSKDILLDKTFASAIKFEEDKANRVRNKFKTAEYLKPTTILQTGDRIVVVKEEKYDIYFNKHPIYYANNLVLSSFDQKLNNIETIGIRRENQSVFMNRTFTGFHIKDNKLFIASQVTKSHSQLTPFLFQVDLEKMKLENITDLYTMNVKHLAEGGATVWFENSCLMSCLDMKGIMGWTNTLLLELKL